ncbi:MAG: enoyl-CoA hydratase/isomerase family protein [Deltaproteobacteria bacterium]|nr:enoyl-CoA hydratase/isomerase family protein [Deltaproteobacteria bacterium]
MSEMENLIVVKKEPVCTLIINNPKRRNAFTRGCHASIARALEELTEDKNIRVVIIRGAGEEAFSAGADIIAMPERGSDTNAKPKVQDDSTLISSEAIQKYPYPVIAMLYGFTLGAGCALAMACDIRIASTTVKMGIPTSRMGLLPSPQGFKRFLNAVGYSTAMEMFLTGRMYDSRDCLAMGMVNHLVEQDKLEEYTYQLAEDITRCAPLSLRNSKRILSRIAENPFLSVSEIELFEAMRKEASSSDDHEEAKKAFKEKRKPVFKGQ